MKQRIQFLLYIITFALVISCGSKKSSQEYRLTGSEKSICDTLQLDTTLIGEIRKYNTNEIEPFHYSLSKMYKDGQETELDPIRLRGLVFGETHAKSYDLVFTLKDHFIKKGYTIFLLEDHFDIDKKLDKIGVLKTADKYSVLKQIATDGANYGITNDSLITIIRQFDAKHSLELVGAAGDWCGFVIHNEPGDWKAFAKEVYKVCPDVVDQGTGTVDALADEMRHTKRLYFWWD